LAQFATAGIGAYAQKKAQDKIVALEEKEQTAFSQFTGLSPEMSKQTDNSTRQAIMQQILQQRFATPEAPEFQIKESDEGFVRIDPQTGISEPITTGGEQVRGKIKKPLVEVSTGDLESSFEKDMGKNKAAEYKTVLEDADKSFAFSNNLNAIEVAINDGAYLGAGSSKIVAINEFAAALGLPTDLDKSSNTRMIEQRLNDLTLQATGKLKGAISEKELDLAQKTIFKLGTSEIATRKAVRLLKSLNKYSQGLGEIAEGMETDGTFTTGFRVAKRKYNKEFRTNFKKELEAPIDMNPRGSTKETTPTQPSTGGNKFLGFE
jgi:hypothetical protein